MAGILALQGFDGTRGGGGSDLIRHLRCQYGRYARGLTGDNFINLKSRLDREIARKQSKQFVILDPYRANHLPLALDVPELREQAHSLIGPLRQTKQSRTI